MYPLLYRTLLARIDPERIHRLAVGLLQFAGDFAPARAALRAIYGPGEAHDLRVRAFGLDFAHPIGLASGFDKDGRCLRGLAALGFSFIEIGTVTPRPQPGNPRPRLFRLAEDRALINRMGFPGAGMEALAARLRRPPGVPVGISLGKNRTTPLDDAVNDYIAALTRLYAHGDFFAVNVSSPNTPELRQLQHRAYLDSLLSALMGSLRALGSPLKPLLLKISPDLSWPELDDVIDLALAHGIAGIIATNTTTARPDLRSPHRAEAGGLSGRPLRARSTDIIRYIHRHTGGSLPLIGVGGIFTGADVWEKLRAGAALVQVYTGFIYEGPAFVKKTLRGLRASRAREEGTG